MIIRTPRRRRQIIHMMRIVLRRQPWLTFDSKNNEILEKALR